MKFVLFGATGDLARKKILPAIAALKARGRDIDVIEVSRRSAVPVDVDAGTGYEKLVERLGAGTDEGADAGIVIYLSLAPRLHGMVVQALGERGILVRGTTKLLIEKPFGTDEKSARELDSLISNYLDESDVYRIDHYLGKAGAQKLLDEGAAARPDGAPAIASIRVRLFETKGIDGRGASYDGVGAFRDVGQNHLLEMAAIALVGSGDRTRVFERLVPPENTCINFRRGQYAGYVNEPGAHPGSQTETAFHVETMIDRVRIVLESGKSMPRSEASIEIVSADGTRRTIDLSQGPDAYETIIDAALRGSRREFVGRDEVFALWRYADRAVACWDQVPLEPYGGQNGAHPPFLIQ